MALCGGVVLLLYRCPHEPDIVLGTLHFDASLGAAAEHACGSFLIDWTPDQGGRVLVRHQRAPEKVVWASIPGRSFVCGAEGHEQVSEARGSFFIRSRIDRMFADQRVEKIEQHAAAVEITGSLFHGPETLPYTLTFTCLETNQLGFDLRIAAPQCTRAYLTYASEPEERFFGFGEQFSHFDLKGKRLPIFISEQGIGRGAQPLTFLVDLVARSGGNWSTSYACVPHYLTSRMRSLFLENYAYAAFDLRHADKVQIELFSEHMKGRILYGESPAELIAEYTACTGRMRPLPDWILDGAVVGMQGGTDKVREVLRRLQERNTPVAAVWLQDWVGQRTTNVGKQLWWNWELDREHYPGWEALCKELTAKNVRIMTYVNPFLADVAQHRPCMRNLFAEAAQKGFLVRRSGGGPYLIQNTDFSAGLLDLTHPDARGWMKTVIKEQVIGAGVSGWMADFGEALPYDAVLASGEPPRTFHNHYPEMWAQLNREVIEETGHGDDFVFFMRSGFRNSPHYSTLFWLGDQMVTWDAHDGIKTAVTGLLSSGISGFSFNHSDIGGYTSLRIPLLSRTRSKELLMRWMELNAFTAVYRTHEGIDPSANVQFYSDAETLDHFSRFAKVYRAWGFYRKQLVHAAAETGLPVVRHPFLHYPDDPEVLKLSYQQFMAGDTFLVAPVLDPGKDRVVVYLPRGRWVHLWSGKTLGEPGRGVWTEVPAPMGQPGVFYPEDSAVGAQFVENLRQAGILPKPEAVR